MLEPLPRAPPTLSLARRLKLARRHARAIDAWSNEGGAPGCGEPASGLRVLIIEAEGTMAELYAEVLAGLGHGPSTIAATEDEAVMAAAVCPPDLMLVDHDIASGFAAVKRILASRKIPYILVSGDRLPDRRAPGTPAFLQKPFNEQQLVAAMALALSLRRP